MPASVPPVSTAPPAAVAAEPVRPMAPAEPGPRAARWLPVDWSELPGLAEDRLLLAWPAWRQSCARPPPNWAELCARVQLEPPADEASAQAWLRAHLQPWRVEAVDGRREGLATGYFEPLLEASRRPDARFRTPLHARPAGLSTRRPYWTRQQLDTLPEAMAALRGREIAYVENPMDALLLQIQGSGRLRVTEPDGRVQVVRLAFAGHNDQPYASVGRWLVERGELKLDAASWPAIRAWATRHPQRVNEMLWVNPRVIFFREEPLPDPEIGPRGSMGVPLSPGRSIAVDPQSIPFGTPVWLDTTEPMSGRPLRRLTMAQDSGSAIVGAVRADYFWGWGTEAETQAGRMRQPLRMWVLWPRGAVPARPG